MLRKTLLVTTPLLLAVLSVQAQRGPHVVGGTVVPYGRSAERIEVLLEKDDQALAGRTFTDSRGRYEFRDLMRGIYYVVIELDGYEPVRRRVDLTSDIFGPSLAPNIFLNPEISRSDDRSSDDSDVVDISELRRVYPKNVIDEYGKALEENRKSTRSKVLRRIQ